MRGSIAAVLLLGTLAAISAGVITVSNTTGGWDLTGIYLTSFGARSWGENRIDGSTISEGQEWRIEVPMGIYNIRLVDTDGDTYTRTAVPVMESFDWAVTLDDLDGSQPSGSVYSG
jgi:hypothetical protein